MAQNVIFYGPPGTGKTYALQQEMKRYTDYTFSDVFLEEIEKEYVKNCVVVALILLRENHFLSSSQITQLLQSSGLPDRIKSSVNVQSELECHSLSADKEIIQSEEGYFFIEQEGLWGLSENDFFRSFPSVLQRLTKEEVVSKRYSFVTFHQSYCYEEFVEGIRPSYDSISRQLDYSPKNGIFKNLCEDARQRTDKEFAIFIDEINRGNISEIFGELITLMELDKRAGAENETEVVLPYSKSSFSIPNNLSIYGSMNSADKSIISIDTALRRRFTFKYFPPDVHELRTILSKRGVDAENIQGFNLIKFFEVLNKRIELLLDKEHIIGHTYFLDVKTPEDILQVMTGKVLPTLEEYFYDDFEKILLLFDDVDQNGDSVENCVYESRVLEPTTLMIKRSDNSIDSKRIYRVNPVLSIECFSKILK